LEPYIRPELGILPLRDTAGQAAAEGVVIRYVLPEGPAAAAGLQPGDRLTELDGEVIADAEMLRSSIIAFDPGAEISVKYRRGEQQQAVSLTLGPQTTFVPDSLPPARSQREVPEGQRPPVGSVEIKIPEVANKCMAYVPESYGSAASYGLMVWLHAPGSFDADELVQRWKPLCDQYDLILLAPQSADIRRWTPNEFEFVRKTMDDVIGNYAIDPTRVVLHGYLAGGAMAYHVGFSNRDISRAIAPVAASLPVRVGVPQTDPVQPMAIYSCSSPESEGAEQIQAGEKKLQERAFPVEVVRLPQPRRYLNSDELQRLMRWVDALDRI
jgi:hypothetical protein